jgi:hypothetical protein
MLIECLIKREGPTHVTVAGFDYVFTKNDEGRKVCEVLSSDHQSYLLAFPKLYREYKPANAQEPEAEAEEPQRGSEDEGPEDDGDEADEETAQVENSDGLIFNAKGKPFANEAVAKRTRKSFKEPDLEIVEVEGGYALKR